MRTACRLGARRIAGRGFVNYLEAQALIRRLEAWARKEATKSCAVAVLALYEGQVELLRRLVEQSEILRAGGFPLEVSAPSRMHQRECDVVFLSSTRSHAHRCVAFGEDAKELPLALTRRTRLLVFGDPGAMSSAPAGTARSTNSMPSPPSRSCCGLFALAVLPAIASTLPAAGQRYRQVIRHFPEKPKIPSRSAIFLLTWDSRCLHNNITLRHPHGRRMPAAVRGTAQMRSRTGGGCNSLERPRELTVVCCGRNQPPKPLPTTNDVMTLLGFLWAALVFGRVLRWSDPGCCERCSDSCAGRILAPVHRPARRFLSSLLPWWFYPIMAPSQAQPTHCRRSHPFRRS